MDAREQLRSAHEMFAPMGAEAPRAPRGRSRRLFIRPRTVQYHLHKVFAKLGISSRDVLEAVLPGAGAYSRGST